jgi:hypothetical protein
MDILNTKVVDSGTSTDNENQYNFSDQELENLRMQAEALKKTSLERDLTLEESRILTVWFRQSREKNFSFKGKKPAKEKRSKAKPRAKAVDTSAALENFFSKLDI